MKEKLLLNAPKDWWVRPITVPRGIDLYLLHTAMVLGCLFIPKPLHLWRCTDFITASAKEKRINNQKSQKKKKKKGSLFSGRLPICLPDQLIEVFGI